MTSNNQENIEIKIEDSENNENIPTGTPINRVFVEVPLINVENITNITPITPIMYGPPSYTELPIYTIQNQRFTSLDYYPELIYDPPPSYNQSMRRTLSIDTTDSDIQRQQQQEQNERRYSSYECKPNTLIPLGFCFCTLEQIIVTIALICAFLFLVLGQMIG